MNEGVDTTAYPNTSEVRDWAAAKSNVATMGRLPRFVILAWNKAHPDRPYLPNESFHGTHRGYTLCGCRCDRCLAAGHEYERERRRYNRDERGAIDPAYLLFAILLAPIAAWCWLPSAWWIVAEFVLIGVVLALGCARAAGRPMPAVRPCPCGGGCNVRQMSVVDAAAHVLAAELQQDIAEGWTA